MKGSKRSQEETVNTSSGAIVIHRRQFGINRGALLAQFINAKARNILAPLVYGALGQTQEIRDSGLSPKKTDNGVGFHGI